MKPTLKKRSRHDAIVAAANHIARYPEEFRYSSTNIPTAKKCGISGCAAGWIAFFRQDPRTDGMDFLRAAETALRVPYWEVFEARLDDIAPDFAWKTSAARCAKALRAYARKYHPKKKKVAA